MQTILKLNATMAVIERKDNPMINIETENPTKDQIRLALILNALQGISYNGQISLMQNSHNRYKSYMTVYDSIREMIPERLFRLMDKVIHIYDRDMPLSKALGCDDIDFLTNVVYEHFDDIRYLIHSCSYGPADKKPWMENINKEKS